MGGFLLNKNAFYYVEGKFNRQLSHRLLFEDDIR